MAKELIENSIKIYGIGHSDTKTVFNIEKEYDRKHFMFKSLTSISGRILTVSFKYKEGEEEGSSKLPMVIIKSDSEQEIKDFIVDSINTHLAN
jgi:hypothetical protein